MAKRKRTVNQNVLRILLAVYDVLWVGGMERVAQDSEFRSNIELGGVGRKIELSAKYQETAEKVAQVLNLDYCGVDLLETKQGPVVCEVNSNAFFEGLEQATGINVAAAYAKYIFDEICKVKC